MTPPSDPATADDSSDAHARFMRLFLGSEKEIFRYVSPLANRSSVSRGESGRSIDALYRLLQHRRSVDMETHQAIANPARLGPAQIGNWDRNDRKLSGRINELLLLGRAMNDDEVRTLFEAGNPYR